MVFPYDQTNRYDRYPELSVEIKLSRSVHLCALDSIRSLVPGFHYPISFYYVRT